MNTLSLPIRPLGLLLQQSERQDRAILDEPVERRVVRCQWCQPRIGRARFFAGADFSREVTSPSGLGLLSDTICPECLEEQRVKLEQMHPARAA